MKKISLLAALMLITIIGASTASFAVCTATTLSTAGTWGIESQGTGPTGVTGDPYINYLLQITFSSGGTFTGSQWESVAGTISGPTSISGTWTMDTPASSCQGTITVSSPSEHFSFAINNAGKGGTIVQTDAGYNQAGFMVSQGKVTCSATTFKKKQFSLYSYGQIPALGGTVTGSGEILFSTAGTTFTANPTVSLDLNGAGNYTLPATGTTTIGTNCQGTGSIAVTALGSSGVFDVDFYREQRWR